MVTPALYGPVGFETVKLFARDSPYGYVCFDTISQKPISCPYHSPLGDIFLFMIIGLLGSIFMSSLAFGLWVEFLDISQGIRHRLRDRSQRNYEPLLNYEIDLEKNSAATEGQECSVKPEAKGSDSEPIN